MNLEYVIFDKDGTLIDFDAFWGKMTEQAVCDLLTAWNIDMIHKNPIMELYGYENGVADITGLFAGGTYEMIAEATYDYLTKEGYTLDYEPFYKDLKEKFHQSSSAGEVVATCNDIQGFFKELQKKGIRCAVVTSDDSHVTKKCLETLGISQYFDAIFAADGVEPAKPDPYYINKLCAEKGVKKEELLMVGDTLIDVAFARNGGIKIAAVAKDDKNRKTLLPVADVVMHDISCLFDVIDAL